MKKDFEEETASDSQNSINEKINLQNKIYFDSQNLPKSKSDIFHKKIKNNNYFKNSRIHSYHSKIFSKFLLN